MKEIEKWINRNYERLVENATKITRSKDDAGDVLHICILSLLEYPADKQMRLLNEGKLENYMTICVNRQWKSSTSPYHRQHRLQPQSETEFVEWKHQQEIEEKDAYDEMCDCVFEEIPKLHFYYRILVEDKFINGLTYAEMNAKYRISKNSLLRDVKEGVRMLKQICDKNGK